jgi:hypothetical protein
MSKAHGTCEQQNVCIILVGKLEGNETIRDGRIAYGAC